MENNVKITVDGRELRARAGTRLSELLGIDQPCGGRGLCGKCRVRVNGEYRLACQYIIESDITVETEAVGDVLSVTGAEPSGRETENMCLALDVGTTTLALALVSLDDKRVVRVATAPNPQRRFGADVISRIDYCTRNTVAPLHSVLTETVNRMIKSIGAGELDELFVSANVTMLHTLFGVDCSSMGVAPYTPAFLESRRQSAETLGIEGVRTVVSLPSIAAFVGADIVAGLNLLDAPTQSKHHLLVDLGTNAEIVLFSAQSGVATSAAAGPCFEGANISCGMSATEGAVCSFAINEGRPLYKTIGGGIARGVCGTGLIDLIAELLRCGVIDETGYMEEDYPLSDAVTLERDDVRQFQLAKSAVYSAILCLMRERGIGFEDIDKMYVSGGFSSAVNVRNAVLCGLLPRQLEGRTVTLHNSSLLGTVKYVCSGGDVDAIVRKIAYLDLADSPDFARLFIENMKLKQ